MDFLHDVITLDYDSSLNDKKKKTELLNALVMILLKPVLSCINDVFIAL